MLIVAFNLHLRPGFDTDDGIYCCLPSCAWRCYRYRGSLEEDVRALILPNNSSTERRASRLLTLPRRLARCEGIQHTEPRQAQALSPQACALRNAFQCYASIKMLLWCAARARRPSVVGVSWLRPLPMQQVRADRMRRCEAVELWPLIDHVWA